jgi:hypothetical protein
MDPKYLPDQIVKRSTLQKLLELPRHGNSLAPISNSVQFKYNFTDYDIYVKKSLHI